MPEQDKTDDQRIRDLEKEIAFREENPLAPVGPDPDAKLTHVTRRKEDGTLETKKVEEGEQVPTVKHVEQTVTEEWRQNNRNKAAIPPKNLNPTTGLSYPGESETLSEAAAEPQVEERMLKHFDPKDQSSTDTQAVKQRYAALAQGIVGLIDPGPERTVALRKLLESLDAAIRAKINPGG